MSKSDMIEVEGTVIEVLPNTTFKVSLQNNHIIFSPNHKGLVYRRLIFSHTL